MRRPLFANAIGELLFTFASVSSLSTFADVSMIAPRVWFQHFITTPRRKLIAKTMNNNHRLFSSNLPSGSSCASPNQYHQRNDDDDEIQIIGERIGEYFYLFFKLFFS
jgi:hypothetical protein